MKTTTARKPKFLPLSLLLLMFFALWASPNANAQPIPAPPGMIAWWPADGNANDIFGTNHGVLLGGATATAVGKGGQAFYLNGTSAYIAVPGFPSLDLPSGMTIEMWIMPYVPLSEQAQWARIVDHSDDATGHQGWRLITPGSQTVYPSLGTGTLLFESWDSVGNWKYALAGDADSLWPYQFSHLAATYDRTQSEMAIYINGVARVRSVVGIFQMHTATNLLRIGKGNVSAAADLFYGRIDEVTLYNRPLGSNEIAAIYAAGAAGKCKDPLIIQHPQSQIGYWGKSVTFTVSAKGTQPFGYQWLKDGVPLPGETDLALTLSNLDATNSGAYSVTVSNAVASVTTYPGQLSVSPVEMSFALYGGILMNGVVGQTYGIQTTTDLSNTNSWAGLTNITLETSTHLWHDSQPATQPKRYYRVLPGPISIR